MSAPLVSVALPVYNGADYVASCIDGVLSQTYGQLELVIADAGSSDDTEAICRSYAANDQRVKYARAASYRGVHENYQAALEGASGDFVCFVAADDAIEPRFIEKCMNAHLANGKLALVFATTAEIPDTWKPEADIPVDTTYEDDTLELDSPRVSTRLRELIRHLHACNAFNGVHRTETIRATLPFGAHQGWDRVTLAAIVMRGRCLQLPEHLQYRRVHEEQVSKGLYGERAERLFNRKLPELAYLESVNLFFKHLRAVVKAPIGLGDKVRCLGVVFVRWPLVRRFYFGDEWRMFRKRRAAR
ncbi:MAG: glycosyltransferase family 2 protein [Gaiellaceae bacterium]